MENQKAQLSTTKAQVLGLVRQSQEQAARLETTTKKLNLQIFDKDREIITKTAEAEAEASGIGITSKPGRGPKYRELTEQLQRLEETKKNLELQLHAYNQRLAAARKVIVGHESEVVAINAELQQLDNQTLSEQESNGPAQRTKLAGTLRSGALDALQRLKNGRIAFEQNPTRAGLDVLQSVCSTIIDLLSGSTVLTSKVSASSCDPGTTHEAASRLYSLNEGTIALGLNCSGDQRASSGGGVEAQLAMARSCLQYSRLLPSDTVEIRADINALERNRDDLAHRFVVTTNAFTDGNRLAYLALAIAVAIDSLVFMSGLFGANAAHSPKSPVPQNDRLTSRQIEGMIYSALLPNVFKNAASALEIIKPVADTVNSSIGWTHEIDLRRGSRPRRRVSCEGSSMPAFRLTSFGVTPRVRSIIFCEANSLNRCMTLRDQAFIKNQGNGGFSDLALHADTVLRIPSSVLGKTRLLISVAHVRRQSGRC